MDWKEKIKNGMKLITEGCGENNEWAKCSECPFGDFCDSLERAGWVTPESWGED